MTSRAIGDLTVGPISLGGFAFGFRNRETDKASTAAIHAAIDNGITLIDSALAYTSMEEPAHADRIIGQAVRSHRDGSDVVIATKGGHYRAGESEWKNDGRPEALRTHCEESLKALGRDVIDLYYLHWPDAELPFEESVGGLARLREEGKIRHIGLSNVTIEQIETAREIVDVAAVQNPYSPFARTDEPTLRHCEAHRIAYVPYSPLGGGRHAKDILDELPAAAAIAEARGVSPQQVVLAWHLAQSPVLVPIVGATRLESIRDSAAAVHLRLNSDELGALQTA